MRNNLAPVVLFVFNRPVHTLRTLQALKKNHLANESTLYVYCDGPKVNASAKELEKISEVRRIVKQEKWCGDVHVIDSETNNGLAASILKGVTETVNRYGKVIVLEDDLETSPGFLSYMNDALRMYEPEPSVMHVSGYMFPVKEKFPSTFFYNCASCWGWGTWKRAWDKLETDASDLYDQLKKRGLMDKFSLDGLTNYEGQLLQNINKIKTTWAIKWHASVVLNNGYCLHPYPSLVNNIGHDESGENCGGSNIYSWTQLAEGVPVEKIDLTESRKARKAMKAFFKAENFQNTIIKLKAKVPSGIKNVLKKLISFVSNFNLVYLNQRNTKTQRPV